MCLCGGEEGCKYVSVLVSVLKSLVSLLVFVQVEDVKGELQERYKVLPGLNTRITELETQYEDMREKNRQLEQKLAAMQVCVCVLPCLCVRKREKKYLH